MRMIGLILIFVIFVVIGSAYFFKKDLKRNQNTTETVTADEESVRLLVERFGSKLKNVSVLSPEESLKESITLNYSDYITEALLEKWLREPRLAPGRETSSPWPEEIEITKVTSVRKDVYEVTGTVFEMTTSSQTDPALTRPIKVIVEKENGQFRISEVDYNRK